MKRIILLILIISLMFIAGCNAGSKIFVTDVIKQCSTRFPPFFEIHVQNIGNETANNIRYFCTVTLINGIQSDEYEITYNNEGDNYCIPKFPNTLRSKEKGYLYVDFCSENTFIKNIDDVEVLRLRIVPESISARETITNINVSKL